MNHRIQPVLHSTADIHVATGRSGSMGSFVGILRLALLVFVGLPTSRLQGDENRPLQISTFVAAQGTDEWDWTQARTAYVPGNAPMWITTMSKTGKTGTHAYHDIYVTISQDSGKTWSEPKSIPSLKRVTAADGYEVVPGDLWPRLHATSGMVLTTGKTFNFEGGTRENILREKVSYIVMDPGTKKWGTMRTLEMPNADHQHKPMLAANAGCHQRVDLPNGDVLLPVRYQKDAKKRIYTCIVVRCGFDGRRLTYKEHGSEHTILKGRGLYEPSLATFGGEYFLTMRADHSAFAAKGSDGIHFGPFKEWTFDDGSVLGSYNTQQHWVTIGGRLFLVYTRRGADNDHIMRHRAPLFIGQVDPQRLCVLRATEQVLLPENHATLGNSGVCRLSDRETWVTCAEGRVSYGKRKGEPNKVLVARITVAGQ